jgi:hypothetical protein
MANQENPKEKPSEKQMNNPGAEDYIAKNKFIHILRLFKICSFPIQYIEIIDILLPIQYIEIIDISYRKQSLE